MRRSTLGGSQPTCSSSSSPARSTRASSPQLQPVEQASSRSTLFGVSSLAWSGGPVCGAAATGTSAGSAPGSAAARSPREPHGSQVLVRVPSNVCVAWQDARCVTGARISCSSCRPVDRYGWRSFGSRTRTTLISSDSPILTLTGASPAPAARTLNRLAPPSTPTRLPSPSCRHQPCRRPTQAPPEPRPRPRVQLHARHTRACVLLVFACLPHTHVGTWALLPPHRVSAHSQSKHAARTRTCPCAHAPHPSTGHACRSRELRDRVRAARL